jgi:hypothetical protein
MLNKKKLKKTKSKERKKLKIKNRERKVRKKRKFRGEIACYFINSSKLSHKINNCLRRIGL